MKELFTPARGRHWADINEFSFIAGMRVLFWLCRVFGRWPFRAVLYPVVLWYVFTKPAARAASRDYLRRMAQQDGIGWRKPGGFHVLRHFVSFAENILDKMLLWSGVLPNDAVEYQNLDLIAAQMPRAPARRGSGRRVHWRTARIERRIGERAAHAGRRTPYPGCHAHRASLAACAARRRRSPAPSPHRRRWSSGRKPVPQPVSRRLCWLARQHCPASRQAR